jgi:hypothetical protein
VATGEEQRLIIQALSAELVRAMDLVSCELHTTPRIGTRPSVARDGSLVGLLTRAHNTMATQIDLPVWSQGEVVAHYRLTLGAKMPSREELRIALSLADQAGAALATPIQPPPPNQLARLRLMPSPNGPDAATGGPADLEFEDDPSRGRHPDGEPSNRSVIGPRLASMPG